MTANELYNLGYYHYTGQNGYPFNYEKAYDYFMQAATVGSSAAMNYLGVMYQNGKGVSKNMQAAADWFYKAIKADNGNAYAAHNLGNLYYNGTGVPQDMNKAFQFFEASVNLGLGNTHSVYPNSCYMAGLIMINHFKNQKRAVPFFVDAAKYGNIPEAWHNLGWLCEQGAMDVKRADIPGTAVGFYKEAANLGLAASMDSVGRLYASVQMLNEARPWIEKAASLGYEPSKKRLKSLNIAQGGSLWDLFK